VHPALARTNHRPWPLPRRPWVGRQRWHDLLFAHWRVDVEVLRPKVPAVFDLNEFDSSAWLGVVPFTMTNVAARGMPALPWLSAFPELNVRTYVSARDGKRGVYFFSLDASRWLAVLTARGAFNLPYFPAVMRARRHGAAVAYRSRRFGSVAAFDATYEPAGDTFTPSPGTLEHFLTERYCLYHVNPLGQPSRLEIHHGPWRLRAARAEISLNRMTEPIGVPLEGTPLLHVVARQDVVAWWPEALRA
jgi:uncharacterized protein YqjF (DUF2071 family)